MLAEKIIWNTLHQSPTKWEILTTQNFIEKSALKILKEKSKEREVKKEPNILESIKILFLQQKTLKVQSHHIPENIQTILRISTSSRQIKNIPQIIKLREAFTQVQKKRKINLHILKAKNRIDTSLQRPDIKIDHLTDTTKEGSKVLFIEMNNLLSRGKDTLFRIPKHSTKQWKRILGQIGQDTFKNQIQVNPSLTMTTQKISPTKVTLENWWKIISRSRMSYLAMYRKVQRTAEVQQTTDIHI